MTSVSRRAKEFTIGLNGKLWPMAGAFIICALASIWYWVIMAPALDYGLAKDVAFDRPVAKAGESVMIHFRNITWNRLYYSELIQRVYCNVAEGNGTAVARIDLPTYVIQTPPERVKQLDKRRAFRIPVECKPGLMTYRAYSQSRVPVIGVWVYANVPEIKINIID